MKIEPEPNVMYRGRDKEGINFIAQTQDEHDYLNEFVVFPERVRVVRVSEIEYRVELAPKEVEPEPVKKKAPRKKAAVKKDEAPTEGE